MKTCSSSSGTYQNIRLKQTATTQSASDSLVSAGNPQAEESQDKNKDETITPSVSSVCRPSITRACELVTAQAPSTGQNMATTLELCSCSVRCAEHEDVMFVQSSETFALPQNVETPKKTCVSESPAPPPAYPPVNTVRETTANHRGKVRQRPKQVSHSVTNDVIVIFAGGNIPSFPDRRSHTESVQQPKSSSAPHRVPCSSLSGPLLR